MAQTEREKQLYAERGQIVIEILENLNILLSCDWDSTTVKSRLEKFMRDFNKIENEIEVLDQQQKN